MCTQQYRGVGDMSDTLYREHLAYRCVCVRVCVQTLDINKLYLHRWFTPIPAVDFTMSSATITTSLCYDNKVSVDTLMSIFPQYSVHIVRRTVCIGVNNPLRNHIISNNEYRH